jgi:hypothetical protein
MLMLSGRKFSRALPMNIADLDAFIDEGLRISKAHHYYPHDFERMRARWTTRGAIRRLVVSGDLQSGFNKMKDLGLLEWTVEAAVLKFPNEADVQDGAIEVYLIPTKVHGFARA